MTWKGTGIWKGTDPNGLAAMAQSRGLNEPPDPELPDIPASGRDLAASLARSRSAKARGRGISRQGDREAE